MRQRRDGKLLPVTMHFSSLIAEEVSLLVVTPAQPHNTIADKAATSAEPNNFSDNGFTTNS